MRIVIWLFSLLFTQQLYAQKEDHQWLFGFLIDETWESEWLADTTWGASTIDFNYSPPKIYYDSTRIIDFSGANASFSDSNGNLLLYTNGQAVYNSLSNILVDSINYGTYWENWVVNYYGNSVYTGLPIIQSSIILNIESTYYVFNHFYDDFNFSNILTFSTIHEKDGVLEQVTKDEIIPNSPSIGRSRFNAVRHGNGRDWWLITSGLKNGDYHVFLLDETGVHFHQDFIFENNDNRTGGIGQLVSSPKGNKVAVVNNHDAQGNNGVFVAFMNFDRCSGVLSGFEYETISAHNITSGIAFSQDGNLVYACNGNFMYQYETLESDVIYSRMTVAIHDGFNYFYPPDTTFGFSTAFSYMGLAPDGKIYVASASGSNRLLSRIEYPNKKGMECDVNQHSVAIPTSYANTMPNFPNFRLGPLDGSECDSLGIDNIPVAKFRCEQDSSDSFEYHFVDLSYFEPENWIYSINGEENNEKDISYTFPSTGTYEICLEVSNENGVDSFCKSIVIGIVNSVEERIEYVEFINVYPNPFKDEITISFHDYFPIKSEIICYDIEGRIVSKLSLIHI